MDNRETLAANGEPILGAATHMINCLLRLAQVQTACCDYHFSEVAPCPKR